VRSGSGPDSRAPGLPGPPPTAIRQRRRQYFRLRNFATVNTYRFGVSTPDSTYCAPMRLLGSAKNV